MNHHVRYRNLGQLQEPAKHIALVPLDFPFAVQNVDRAHQLLMAGNSRIQLDQRNAAETQHAADQRLDCADDRSENGYEEQHKRRDQQRNAVGIGDRDRLRHHLAENDDQRGHDNGRGPHSVIAVEIKKHAGGDRRRADGDKLAPKQHRADEPPAHSDQARDQFRPVVAGHFKRMHPRPRSCGQGGLGAGEKRRGGYAQGDDDDSDAIRHGPILARAQARVMQARLDSRI